MKNARLIDAELPNCPKHEEALLGSIACYAFTVGNPFAEIAGRVDESDFLDTGFGQLFRVFQQMTDAGLPIHDPLVVRTCCTEARLPESLTNSGFLSKLINAAPNAAHLNFYADDVRNTAQKRRLILAATKLLEAGYDSAVEWRHAAGSAEADLARIVGNIQVETETIGSLAKSVVQDLRAEAAKSLRSACMTGIIPLDEVVGPLMRKELIVIAARPGIGKTAFGMQAAMHAAEKGKRVFFASLEMTGEELATRVVCRIADVNSRRVRAGDIGLETIGTLDEAAKSIKALPVHVWSPPTGTLSQIRGLAKHLHAKEPLSLVVVDYLQNITAGKSERGLPRHEQVGIFSSGLRALSKELDIPVVALAQFNRVAENQEPSLANLRESGNIEQDANIVIGLHSGDSADDKGDPFTVSAIVLKHRAGMKGRINLTFYPVETRFGECVTGPAVRPQAGRRQVFPRTTANNF